MSIAKEKKVELIKEHAQNPKDTGSVDVQCAILTERINALTDHLQGNKHDSQAKRGLIALVVRRRKLLKYLGNKNEQRYQDLIKKLGIRK
jgi:small subunit ribosomal protein S15